MVAHFHILCETIAFVLFAVRFCVCVYKTTWHKYVCTWKVMLHPNEIGCRVNNIDELNAYKSSQWLIKCIHFTHRVLFRSSIWVFGNILQQPKFHSWSPFSKMHTVDTTIWPHLTLTLLPHSSSNKITKCKWEINVQSLSFRIGTSPRKSIGFIGGEVQWRCGTSWHRMSSRYDCISTKSGIFGW